MSATTPAELDEFMRTFVVPGGGSVQEYLARASGLMNDGGPTARVERAVPIADVDGWNLTVDVYATDSPAAHAMVWFHGGAWTMGNPASHDRLAREFAARSIPVFSVDYPRAPKWAFPVGVDACVVAAEWVADNAERFGADPGRLAIGGDSAGANLAAAVLATRPAGLPERLAGVLAYGIYNFERAYPVLLPLLDGREYARPGQHAGDERLSPQRAADRMPPTWFGVGTDDPLLAETLALQPFVGGSELFLAQGEPHSFLQLPHRAGHDRGLDSAAAFVQRILG